MSLTEWALPQISKLLSLDEESLLQIITYSTSLPKDAAAKHLKDLLGDSPRALEFISSFNSRRQGPVSSPASSSKAPLASTNDGPLLPVPKSKPRKKKGSDLNKLPPPRKVEDGGLFATGYTKKNEEDYMAGRQKSRKEETQKIHSGLQSSPASSLHTPPSTSHEVSAPMPSVSDTTPKLPPSAAGRLISDPKPKSQTTSAKSKATKVTITGGTPMHGQSTALSDLDSAIRALEIQTNPTLAPTAADNVKRSCNCMATRHELLTVAPNCLNCGKIICAKEGLGPCTFCGTRLLSGTEVESMMRILREERGKERMQSQNATHRRAEVSKAPRPFAASHQSSPATSAPPSDNESDKLTAAKQHRDKLLAFQANNAQRTKIHDEVSDFETPTAGQNMWASPAERAMQLKRQQKALREQEWNARPEWEKRRVVASIDLAGGKIIKKMTHIQRPRTPEEDEKPEVLPIEEAISSRGTFGRNPLLGGLIRPVAKVDGKGKEKATAAEKATKWRRVQDDNDNNEQWILDGGLLGGGETGASEEPACG